MMKMLKMKPSGISRRGLLTGLISVLAAPAIVRASSLMPIRAPKLIVAESEIDLVLGSGVVLMWMTESVARVVAAGLHPRYAPANTVVYCIGPIEGLEDDFQGLDMPQLS